MMQRGYIVLISGGGLFAIGIALSATWGMQFAEVFLQDNTLVSEVSVSPGQSIHATRQVTDTSRPLSIAIHIQGITEGNEALLREDVRLVQAVRDPSGDIVNRNEFSGNLFTSFKPEQAGNHVLTISNVGTRSVTIDSTFGYIPFIDGQQVHFDQLSAVIAGAILIMIGFLAIIAGVVIVIVDSRKKGSSTTTTSEDGITYRKD